MCKRSYRHIASACIHCWGGILLGTLGHPKRNQSTQIQQNIANTHSDGIEYANYSFDGCGQCRFYQLKRACLRKSRIERGYAAVCGLAKRSLLLGSRGNLVLPRSSPN